MLLLKQFGFSPNRLTNMWVPFVVGGTACLRTGGRLAMVLPAELLQVSYARALRGFLAQRFERITVVTCNDLFFPDAQQEVVLLLAEGHRPRPDGRTQAGIRLMQLEAGGSLPPVDRTTNGRTRHCGRIDHGSDKWLKYFLSPVEFGLMERLQSSPSVGRLGDHGSVDVGVVTGNNDFFVLGRVDVERWGLGEYVVPLIGRTSQLKGGVIDRSEWKDLAARDERVFLLHIRPDQQAGLPEGCRKYICRGEESGVPIGYKCSIREPWYCVPAVWSPDCFVFRQIYDFPRMVLNLAGACSTDTIHRLRLRNPQKAPLLHGLFYNHLTAASAEIEGRSYGGGVLELEPTEAERLLVPDLGTAPRPVSETDRFLREGKVEALLAENDAAVLCQGLGLSKRDCCTLRRIWSKMRDRRRSRPRRNGNGHSS